MNIHRLQTDKYSMMFKPSLTFILTLLYGRLNYIYLLPTGSEEREVLGEGGIPVAILPSCQDVKTFAF